MFSKVLFATLFSLLLFVGLQVTVEATDGSSAQQSRRDSSACLVKEPSSYEESDSKEDCSPFNPKPPTSPAPAPQTSSGAPSTSSAAPSSSSDGSTSSPGSTASSATESSTTGSTGASSSDGSTVASSSVSPPPDNYTSRCRLKKALVSISLTLSVSEKVKFDLLIVEIENEILSNKCGCLSGEDKIVKVGLKLKKFLSKNKSIKKKVHYKKIGSWGMWRELVEIGVSIQGERTPEILELDGSDDCKLFKALRNGTEGNATETAEIETLIVQIRLVLKKGGWSKTQKNAKIHKLKKEFFKTRVELELKINKVEIEGLGSVENFRRVFKVAHQTTRLSKVISGSNDNDCELLKKLKAVADNETIDPALTEQIRNLHGVLKAKFEIEVDLVIRLQYISQQCHEFLLQSPWIVDLLMDIELEDNDPECGCDNGKWGDVFELLFVSHFCTNEGSCGEAGGGEGTEPTGASTDSTVAQSSSTGAPSSSSAAPSSSSAAPSSSSAAPSSSSAAASSSSAAPATTTVAPLICGNRPQLIVVNGSSHGNASILEYSIQVVYDSWPQPQRSSYDTTKNKIRITILGSLSVSAKINKIKDYMLAYSPFNATMRALQMNIVMKEGNFNGKIRDFCEVCGYM